MGVITTAPLSSGTLIGPIPTTLTLTDPAYLIGHMTCDNRPDVHTVKLDINEYADGSRAGEWLPYVQAARDHVEQNLEALMSSSGKLHYRSLRYLKAGEELLVWYDEEMAKKLDVPEIKSYYVKEGCLYCCPSCDMSFRFPYSLRAHMRFRCQQRLDKKVTTPEPSPATVQTTSPSYTEYLSKEESRDTKALYNPYHHIKCNVFSPSDPRGGLVPSPTSSISPGTSSNGSSSPPFTEAHKTVTRTHPISPEDKIRYSESDSSSNDTPFSAPLNLKRSTQRRMSGNDDVMHGKRQKMDQNQNDVTNGSDEENMSAFRKVEKHLSSPKAKEREVNCYQIGTTATTSLLSNSHPLLGNASINADKLMASQHHQHLMAKFRPMMPPGGLPASYLPGFRGPTGGPENFPLNLTDFYSRSIKMESSSSGMPHNNSYDRHQAMRMGETDAMMDLRNMSSPPTSSPSQLAGNVPTSSPTEHFINRNPAQFRNPLQFYRSPNPVVDKLLNSATSPMNSPAAAFTPLVPNTLMQNWCAKCNATFRMTSDLVYHMRSHHKSVTGLTVKKKEDKLKCAICSETFKERHHLTRHMSSHM